MIIEDEFEPTTAWDCDPAFVPEELAYDLDLDEELDETDWQVIVLDRFGDRMVNASYTQRAYNRLGVY